MPQNKSILRWKLVLGVQTIDIHGSNHRYPWFHIIDIHGSNGHIMLCVAVASQVTSNDTLQGMSEKGFWKV